MFGEHIRLDRIGARVGKQLCAKCHTILFSRIIGENETERLVQTTNTDSATGTRSSINKHFCLEVAL